MDLPDDLPASEGEGDDPGGARGSRSPAWCRLVALGDERKVLWELTQRDPLDLAERCTDRMRARAVLLQADRVFVRAAARIAYHARGYDGALAIDAWLAGRIDQAIDELVREDRTEDRAGAALDPRDERYRELAAILATDVRTMRRASVVFHSLPLEERGAFWAVLIDRKPIDRYAAEAGVSLEVAKRRFERAVATFLSLGARRDLPGEGPPEKRRRRP